MDWTHDGLWQKAKLYVGRALDEPRDGPLFPFWASLALEFLARAALARVHPVLLADPTEGENILYACGFPGPKHQPKTVPMHTVVSRCRRVMPDFSEEHGKTISALANRRNQELHTGAPAFDDYPPHLWQANYYRVCSVLLASQSKTLADLLGDDEAVAAERMIATADEQVVRRTKEKIGRAQSTFAARLAPEQAVARAAAERKVKWTTRFGGSAVPCPACATSALLSGDLVSEAEPRLEGDEIVRRRVYLPTALDCAACDLELRGHDELAVASVAGQFASEERENATEFFSSNGSEVDPADYYEPEYGND